MPSWPPTIQPAPLASPGPGAACPSRYDGLQWISCQDWGRGRLAQSGDHRNQRQTPPIQSRHLPFGLRILNTVLHAAMTAGPEPAPQPKHAHRASPKARAGWAREVGQALTRETRAPGPSAPSPPVSPPTHAGLGALETPPLTLCLVGLGLPLLGSTDTKPHPRVSFPPRASAPGALPPQACQPAGIWDSH